jgi:alkane 1-monooxygenase
VDYLRYYLGPAIVLAGVVGFVLGGGWVWLGASTFLFLLVLDLAALRPELATREIAHPRLVELPLYLHALLMAALVITAAWRVHAGVGAGGVAGVIASMAWLSVLPNIPVAHEFVHRRDKLSRALGFFLTVVIADPVRRLAHLRGHHVDLGLPEDPDTARRGESIYAFMMRAAFTATRDSIASERVRLRKKGLSLWSWQSDLVRSLVLTALALALAAWLAGPRAALVLLTASLAARFLLESFNYLQHYGLVRAPGTRYARRHTWSHLTPVVRAVAFEITNHAHHHMEPQVPFYALVPDPEAPQMPSALLCFLAALIPPVFERVIAKPRLEDWDRRYATPDERALAAAANAAAGWPDWSARLSAM